MATKEAVDLVQIKVEKISKTFGRRKVLKEVSFEVKKGEFLTIFGPNGVGKTTLVKILSTIINPTSGQLFIAGTDALREPVLAREKIGLISHNPFLYYDLSAFQNLRFYGKLYAVEELDKRIDEVLDLVELYHRKFDIVRTFSKGMQQRLSIARALLHKPSILFLDEPHSGLDPHAVEILDSTIRKFGKENATFIMTTHNLAKGLELSNRVIILSHEGVVFDEKTSSIDENEVKEIYLKYAGEEYEAN